MSRPKTAAPNAPMAPRISPSAFRLVPASPLMGRPLVDADEDAFVAAGRCHRRSAVGDRASIAIRAILGRTIIIAKTKHTIVGVMPEAFGFPVNHNLWIPLRDDGAPVKRGEGPPLSVFGRLTPGVDARCCAGGARRGDDARGLRRIRDGINDCVPEVKDLRAVRSARGSTRLQPADPISLHGEPRVHCAPAAVRRQRGDTGVRTHRHARRRRSPCARRSAPAAAASSRNWLPKRRCSRRLPPSPASALRGTHSAGSARVGTGAGQRDAVLVERAADRRDVPLHGAPRDHRGADDRRHSRLSRRPDRRCRRVSRMRARARR